jgi:hypothetical protein
MDDEEEEDKDGDHEDELFDKSGAHALRVGVNPEVQELNLTEEEPIELAITHSHLDELASGTASSASRETSHWFMAGARQGVVVYGANLICGFIF